ncbi:MAG: hypothetical protein U0640_01590 [Phycisphaerales bacterium]
MADQLVQPAKSKAIVSRERVSKDGAKLEVFTLKLSDEWNKRLTIRTKQGLASKLLRRLSA